MEKVKIYGYKACSTCKKAMKFLSDHKIDFTSIAIRETPPKKPELKKMLTYMGGDIKKLFNTSGQDYRSMGLKDKINDLQEREIMELLSSNGNLVKRPFLISDSIGIVGFKEDLWKEIIQDL